MTRLRTGLVAAAATVVVGAAGVGIYWAATMPDSGTVTARRYNPAWTSTTTWCHTAGKTTVCTPETDYHAECWQIVYRAANGRTGYACVPEREYSTYQPGDHYPHRVGAR